ncbi:hypothetical protein [Marinicella sp. W31]|uniref:hypothetical protein n=1 Tax=Marinicella sp. W31 TaxID=3023713 RepID=UPI0037582736
MKTQTIAQQMPAYQLDKWPDFSRLTFSPEVVRMAALLISTPMIYSEILNHCEAEQHEIDLFLSYIEAKGLLK